MPETISASLASFRRKYPEGKITTTAMTVGGKQYNLPSIKQKGNWRQFLKFIQDWKNNPTIKNFVDLSNKLDKGTQQLTRDFRKWLTGKPLYYGQRGGAQTAKVFEAISKDLNLNTSQVSKLKSYTQSVVSAELAKKGTFGSTLRTSIQKGTNDFPEIVKIFDKYKYNTNISNLKNQDAIIDLLKKNPIIAARFKQQGVPLTLKNLKTRIARTHSAVIRNSLDKKSYGDLFKAFSLADRQNFLKNSENIFKNTIHRSFQGQLVETLKGKELQLAREKLKRFTQLKNFVGRKLGEVGARGQAFIQMDHPISLAALEKSGNLNQALRVNPIAGDINQWKRKLDQRLNTLHLNKDVKGLRALNEINQVLFGKGAPSFTVGAEGISKIKGLPADFRKANVLKQLKGNVGLHGTLKENIKNIKPETWKTSGVNKAAAIGELNALKSWKPEVLTRYIDQWTKENPKWTKILEKRIGCQGGCLAATANESPALFSEALKKTPGAARSFLGMLGRGGLKALPFAGLAAAGAAIEPLVKQFRNDDPNTYLTNEGQMKGMLLATIEGETPKVDEEILKWQYPGMAAATVAGAVPGASAVYKARRGIPEHKFVGPMPKGVGPARAALGIKGVLGKALGATFSPLAVAATLPISVAAQRKGGTEWGDIATDPFNWMAPAFASTGAEMATRGMAPTGILAKALRMGMSPRTLSLVARRFGMPGLAISAGMWGYDKWKNRGVNDPED